MLCFLFASAHALPSLAPDGPGDKIRAMAPAQHHCDEDRECSEDWEPRQDMFRAGWMHPMLSDADAKKMSAQEADATGPPDCVSAGCAKGKCSYGSCCCMTQKADYSAVRQNWIHALAQRMAEARERFPAAQRDAVPLDQLLPRQVSDSTTACPPGALAAPRTPALHTASSSAPPRAGGCQLWPGSLRHGLGVGGGWDFERAHDGGAEEGKRTG